MNFSGKRWIGLTTFSLLSLELVDIAGTLVAFGAGGIDGFFVLQRGGGAFRAQEVFGSRGAAFCQDGHEWTLENQRGQRGVGVDDLSPSGMDAADLEGLSFKREFVAAWEVCVQRSVISMSSVSK